MTRLVFGQFGHAHPGGCKAESEESKAQRLAESVQDARERRRIKTFQLNDGELLHIENDYVRDAIAFRFVDFNRFRMEVEGHAFTLPISTASELARAIRAEGGSFELGRGAELIVAPAPENETLSVLFVSGNRTLRAASLLRGARRRFAVAIDQARAAGLDPSLLEEAAMHLEGANGQT